MERKSKAKQRFYEVKRDNWEWIPLFGVKGGGRSQCVILLELVSPVDIVGIG